MIAKLLAFHLNKTISNGTKKKILQHFEFDIESCLEFCKEQGKKFDFKQSEEIIKKIKKQKIKLTTVLDKDYPENLAEIYDPPVCIFSKGNFNILKNKGIAFVGTRRATSYGLSATKKLIEEINLLTNGNLTVISGMATGIDTQAHLTALANNMKTIAVLGCGVNIIYPALNKKLYESLEKNGLIISEFPPDTKPKPYFFPIRNRIISGLSIGVVVVEARKKSGSIITAKLALEQGKEVFAVPGKIFDKGSFGTNNTIKKGEAKLILNGEDILEELIGVEFFKKSDRVLKLELEGVLKHLAISPKTIDELEILTNKNRGELILELTNLELSGKIFKNAANQYIME
jgi:DNA processing protein